MYVSTGWRKKFEDDGTLTVGSTPDQLELRIMLDEVHSQNAIGKYAKVRSLTNDDDYGDDDDDYGDDNHVHDYTDCDDDDYSNTCRNDISVVGDDNDHGDDYISDVAMNVIFIIFYSSFKFR